MLNEWCEMKILFVHDNVFLTKNDKVYSNTFSYSLLKRYVDIFSNVTVLARNLEVADTPDMLLASGEGVSFIFLESISTVNSFFGLRQQHEKRIEKVMKEHDGVIVRLPSELGLLTAKVAKRMHKKCLTEVVGCAWELMWNYGGFKSKVYAAFLFLKMKNSVRNSHYTSYVTKHFLQERYPSSKKARTVAVSDVQLVESNENILLKRVQKIEEMDEKIIFGTIASLSVQYKGIDIALNTLSEISKKYSHFEYHILGEGDPEKYKTVADDLGIADKVFFDGTLPGGEAVLDWLDHIDIYLQSSITEGLSRALIEAMSRACPAVGSSVGGTAELLDKKMLFSSAHPEELSQKIVTLINDKHLMIEAARQNFNQAKQYQKGLLDEKRNKFWVAFREDLIKFNMT